MQSFLIKFARPLEFFLGIIFITGALLKAADINLFSVQIAAYGVITSKSLQPIVALITLTVETGLGCFMLLGFRGRKFTFAVLGALLAVFTALILYGWLFHNLKDCGCFGKLAIGPKTSIAKNILFAAMGLAAWRGFSMGERSHPAARRTAFQLLVTAIVLSATCAYAAFDMLSENAKPPNQTGGPFAQFVFDLPEGHFDLGHGTYFVAMLSMSCEHCIAESPKLNDFMLLPEMPPVVALCLEETPGEMEEYKLQVQPAFPMYSIGDRVRLFFNLIGQEPPRFTLVRDGFPIQSWDETLPPYEELIAAMRNATAPAHP